MILAFWNVLVQLKDIAYSFPFMKHSLLPSSANSDQYSDSCEDEDSDRSSEKEEQEDPADYCKGRGEVVQQSTLSSEWLKLVSVPDPKPTPARIAFSIPRGLYWKWYMRRMRSASQKPTL